MTGHDQFREGVKAAVTSGCFAGDFETHPIGTAKRLKELEEQAIRHREDKAQAVADAVMRARRDWARAAS